MRGETFRRLTARIGRGVQTVFYLLFSLLFLWIIWMRMGYPLPTAEMELRRWERTNLMEYSRVVFSVKGGQTLEGLEGGYSVSFPRDIMVSLGEGRAVIREGVNFHGVWLEDGPAVTRIPGVFSIAAFSGEGPSVPTPVLAFGLPEEAGSGEITLFGEREGEAVPLAGPGWEIGEGVWLFAANPPGTVESWALAPDSACTLRLCRQDGSLLLEWKGTLTES